MIKKKCVNNIQKYVLVNNKGFSLVELIIVIAIMAILSAALAPQLMKYIEQSRVSTDMQTCKSLETAINAALTNETVWSNMNDRPNNFRFYLRMSEDEKTMYIAGLWDNWNSSNEIREHVVGLKNPKQTGKHSYMVQVQVKKTTVASDEGGGTVTTIGDLKVTTSDYKFDRNITSTFNY